MMLRVRTTIDLPDDVHRLVRELAHQQGTSMGNVIAELIRAAHRPSRPEPANGSKGFPVVSVGRPITAEDVRSLDDE